MTVPPPCLTHELGCYYDHEQILSFSTFWPFRHFGEVHLGSTNFVFVPLFELKSDSISDSMAFIFLLSKYYDTTFYDTFIPALWRLVMLLAVAFGFFITALTVFLSSVAIVFLDWLGWCLVCFSVIGFFLFQDIPICCINYTHCMCNGSNFPIKKAIGSNKMWDVLSYLTHLHVNMSNWKLKYIIVY